MPQEELLGTNHVSVFISLLWSGQINNYLFLLRLTALYTSIPDFFLAVVHFLAVAAMVGKCILG